MWVCVYFHFVQGSGTKCKSISNFYLEETIDKYMCNELPKTDRSYPIIPVLLAF